MDAATIATVLLAVIALFGLISAGVAWFYKRGGQERELTISLRANTTATNDLTQRFSSFISRTERVQDDQEHRINNHETRIAVNERDIGDLRKAADIK